LIGAQPHERTEALDQTRKGTRRKTITTAAGDVELSITGLETQLAVTKAWGRHRPVPNPRFGNDSRHVGMAWTAEVRTFDSTTCGSFGTNPGPGFEGQGFFARPPSVEGLSWRCGCSFGEASAVIDVTRHDLDAAPLPVLSDTTPGWI
jgi:hypothetical protein